MGVHFSDATLKLQTDPFGLLNTICITQIIAICLHNIDVTNWVSE